MSLFFRREVEQRVMQPWSDFAHDGPNEAMAVTRATYLGPVFASIRHIVDYVSTLPIDTHRQTSGGGRIPARLPRLLKRLDNPIDIGLNAWFGQLAYGLVVDGNAVGWRPEPDRVVWMHRSEWSYDEVSRQWYILGRNVPRSEVVHIPWIVPPGRRLGLSPIEHYASITAAGLAAQEYANMKRGGGLPPSVLKNETQIVDVKAAEVIEERLAARFSKGRPFVHGKDWTFSAISIPPNHAQFIETMKLTANQIAAIYGLDPTEVGGEAANSQEYTNPEIRQIDRAARMRPYLVRIERGVSRLLNDDTFISFNIDATLRSDAKTRTEVLATKVDKGLLSVNEGRMIEDLPPVAGGDFHNIPAPTRKPEAKESK